MLINNMHLSFAETICDINFASYMYFSVILIDLALMATAMLRSPTCRRPTKSHDQFQPRRALRHRKQEQRFITDGLLAQQ